MDRQGKKILLVEDDEAILKVMGDRLNQEGYDVHKAKNGEEGLKKALDIKPDLIVLDVLMPIMDGMVMMEKLREDSWGASVPIILLTNVNPDDEIVNKVVQVKPAFYLVKNDLEVNELVEKVQDVIGS